MNGREVREVSSVRRGGSRFGIGTWIVSILILALSGCAGLSCQPASITVAKKEERARLGTVPHGYTTETGRLEELRRPEIVRDYWVWDADGLAPSLPRAVPRDRGRAGSGHLPVSVCRQAAFDFPSGIQSGRRILRATVGGDRVSGSPAPHGRVLLVALTPESRGLQLMSAGFVRERRSPGSRPTNDLYLVEDDEPMNVSRTHLQIDCDDAGYVLVDRASTCGTIVEGQIVGGGTRGGTIALHDGDVIIVGTSNSPYAFKFRVG